MFRFKARGGFNENLWSLAAFQRCSLAGAPHVFSSSRTGQAIHSQVLHTQLLPAFLLHLMASHSIFFETATTIEL